MSAIYSTADDAFLDLLSRVVRANNVPSRNGATRELTMQSFTIATPSGVVLPSRKASLPSQIAETAWVLAGRNDIEWLSYYLPRAVDFSDDGKTWRGGYGPRLRRYGDKEVDQLDFVVKLLRQDPATRRAVINIYDADVDSRPGKDVPCNDLLHFLTRNGRLDLHVFTRSNDIMWGWSGINVFEWSALLRVVAGMANLEPGHITFSISSLHLYEKHFERAQKIVESGRPYGTRMVYPSFGFAGDTERLDGLLRHWFAVEGLIRNGRSPEEIGDSIEHFPEPMLRQWLVVLDAWHRGKENDRRLSAGLNAGLAASPKRKVERALAHPFVEFATKLHAEKDTAYGDSWQRRGEMLGIMANIARKVDRLGVAGAGDTAADTAIDLLVYLIKYELWLKGNPATGDVHQHAVGYALEEFSRHADGWAGDGRIAGIRDLFDNHLEPMVEEKREDRVDLVHMLITMVFPLAEELWMKEQEPQPVLTPGPAPQEAFTATITANGRPWNE